MDKNRMTNFKSLALLVGKNSNQKLENNDFGFWGLICMLVIILNCTIILGIIKRLIILNHMSRILKLHDMCTYIVGFAKKMNIINQI
jgi:hypothetical protein